MKILNINLEPSNDNGDLAELLCVQRLQITALIADIERQTRELKALLDAAADVVED